MLPYRATPERSNERVGEEDRKAKRAVMRGADKGRTGEGGAGKGE